MFSLLTDTKTVEDHLDQRFGDIVACNQRELRYGFTVTLTQVNDPRSDRGLLGRVRARSLPLASSDQNLFIAGVASCGDLFCIIYRLNCVSIFSVLPLIVGIR